MEKACKQKDKGRLTAVSWAEKKESRVSGVGMSVAPRSLLDSGSSAGRGVGDPRAFTIYGARTRKFSLYATSGAFVRACFFPRKCIMCEKRGMCTGKRQVPLLVVTTLLVGVRPELVGEYKLIYRDKNGVGKYLNGVTE